MSLRYSCLALMEHEVSLLYEALVEKAEDPGVGLLLFFVLEDTRKHKEVLQRISQVLSERWPPPERECEREMGESFRSSIDFARSLRESVTKRAPFLGVMQRLIDYEGMIGEEYMTLVHARLSVYEEKDAAVKKILEYIAADEGRHQETLRLAAQLASKSK
jgi:rubrerythrin